MKILSLYTGVGALDFGFEAAGFETVAAFDNNAAVIKELKANTTWDAYCQDLVGRPACAVLKETGHQNIEFDLVIGGPPCQPFSKAAYWRNGRTAGLKDPRAATLAAYLEMVETVRPRAFLLENVPGFANGGDASGIAHIKGGVAEMNARLGENYSVTWAKLNAADYGVPQQRERIFLVGRRDGGEFQFPATAYAADTEDPKKSHFTAWDAIGDLPLYPDEDGLQAGGKWADLLPSIPEGENYLWHTNRGGGEQLFGWRTRYWSFLLKLAKDKPSWTLQSQTGSATGPFHWANRKLSKRELCRLQTIPDRINIGAGRMETQRMLGNAVPSLLAEVIALEIRRQIFSDPRACPNKPTLLPKRNAKKPRRHPVRSVPPEYRVYIGNHEDHAGVGLGPGALRRQTLRAAE
ncbi:MAG: DNA cytosine methyltransferase [Pseudomonadota bacterium]